MKRIDICFLLLAVILLLCGAVLGIKMGASENFTLTPVHAHLNLAGWASLALFGLTYRAYPQLAERRLALSLHRLGNRLDPAADRNRGCPPCTDSQCSRSSRRCCGSAMWCCFSFNC